MKKSKTNKNKIEKIYIGGWFQRTTLHLYEIYNFLQEGRSPLDLDAKKLKRLQEALNLKSVEMIMDRMEHIDAVTKDEINIKIYEDGLIVLSTKPNSLKNDIEKLRLYYENKLSKGLNYIFSLGAPAPKELANIQNIYPYFIVLNKSSSKEVQSILKDFEQQKFFEIKRKTFEIYRGNKLYIINNFSEKQQSIERVVEEQIFMREFRTQLHRYLNLHRIIWEKIAEVKERGLIKGSEISKFKNKIESYSKTITLIDTRIAQMGAYIKTRGAIAGKDKDLKRFESVLEYKYETLMDTLDYVKEIWVMTKRYVDSALELFSDLQSQSTSKSINNLAIITSMGVGATLIGLFTKEFPEFTWVGPVYFLILALIGYIADKTMKYLYSRKKYTINDIEEDRNIK